MATSVELRHERARLWERMKEIVDAAERENRDLTGEENGNWDAANRDMTALDARIARLESVERTPATADDVRSRPVAVLERYRGMTTYEITQTEEFKRAFRNYLVRGPNRVSTEDAQLMGLAQGDVSPDMQRELRAMGVSTFAAGGAFASHDFTEGVERAMLAYGGMLQAARSITTSDGIDLPFPVSDDTSNTGELLSEGVAASTLDVATGTRVLKAFMFSSKIVRVSYQLLQDSAFDIEGFLREVFAERIGRVKNTYLTVGVGANQPQGVLIAATSGVTAAAATSIAWDEMLGLEHSVDPSYRVGPKVGFMFSDSTLLLLRKIKDGDGNYIFKTGVTAGAPNTISGYPYYINQDMPAVATGNKTVLFGDFSKYLIRNIQDMQVLRLEELYAATLQVGFLGFMRADGGLIDAGTHPIKYLVQP